MIDKYFIDTNILVYLFSEIEIEKSDKCSDILNQLSNHVQFVLSTQVINEFSNVSISDSIRIYRSKVNHRYSV